MDPQFWWYLSRASGIVAWFLLTASVLVGILLPAKMFNKQRPAWVSDLHSWLGGLTITFLIIHLFGLWADSYIEFDLADFLVPMAADWKPLPVALGVVAMWLIVAVHATSLVMKSIPRRTWRWIHLSSYPAFLFTSLHGTFAGTDATNPIYSYSSSLAVIALVFASVFRVLGGRRKREKPAPSQASSAKV